MLTYKSTGDGIISSVYTYSLQVGSSTTTYPVQVDTGSSDSWIISPSCSTDPCASYSGSRFDPSQNSDVVDTNKSFSIQYLQGSVSGEILWDTFTIGPYALSWQAFGSASTIDNEDLSLGFSGLLALAFPLNSQISQVIPPEDGNIPDGAPVSSNLFGLGAYGPREHFYSILLERPGVTRIPSMLGIGKQPVDLLPSITGLPNNSWTEVLEFNRVVDYSAGSLFWTSAVTGITAYINGTSIPIPVGNSVADPNAIMPVAILDTGSPFIFASSAIVDAFYGAYGIGPGSDGSYYVPCTTPVNMSITLYDQTFPIHPLDVTYVSSDVQDSKYCISAFQASANLTTADFVLGAAFLRNVYTVLSYDRYDSQLWPNLTLPDNEPAIALLSVTNITEALNEFTTVRINHQPLPSSSATPTPGTSSEHHNKSGGLGKLWILVGVVIALGLIIGALLTRWLVRRRQRVKSANRTSLSLDRSTSGDAAIALSSLASVDTGVQRRKAHTVGDADDLNSSTNSRSWAGSWALAKHQSNASFLSSNASTGPTAVGTGDGAGTTQSVNEYGELIAAAGLDDMERGPQELSVRASRASRSRSRGPGATSVSSPLLESYSSNELNRPVPLVTDVSLLTNIPTLEEMTPETLSSSRYPTFARHSLPQPPSPIAVSSLGHRRPHPNPRTPSADATTFAVDLGYYPPGHPGPTEDDTPPSDSYHRPRSQRNNSAGGSSSPTTPRLPLLRGSTAM
ncbi:acid protease [Clavulina sp. PMI_390]|nr:acid protease [Clavulina sp. PMI_390]